MTSSDSDEDDEHLGGLLLPSVRGTGGDEAEAEDSDIEEEAPGRHSEPAQDTAADAAAGGHDEAADGDEDGVEGSECEDDGEPSGLPDAASAFDSTRAPPGAELDPFRMAGAAPLAPCAADLPVGVGKKSTKPKTKFDTVKYHTEHLSNRKLFVGGLPPTASEASVLKFFSRFGKVQEVKLGTHADTGKSRGFAFVVFTYHKGAKFCLEQGEEKEMDGRVIRCEVAASGERPAGALPRRAPPPATTATPGERGTAQPPQRAVAAAAAGAAPARTVEEEGVEKGEAAGGKRRRDRGIVTVTRREDAEPVDKRRISIRDLFPKEFWRI